MAGLIGECSRIGRSWPTLEEIDADAAAGVRRQDLAQAYQRHHRYRVSVLAVLLLATVLIGIDLGRGARTGDGRQVGGLTATTPSARREPAGSPGSGGPHQPAPGPSGQPSPGGHSGGPRTGDAPSRPSGPETGTGGLSYVATGGAVLGTGGDLHRYRVAVENGSGQDAGTFATAVERILGDQRSWIGTGTVRLQRVGRSASAEFTVYLVTPVTADAMCAQGGLHIDRYTSCRLPGKVIINLARWLTAVPDYGAPLATYQAYAINHEVGHQLGHGHEACPAEGRPAPVMQQQTLGLRGCTANSWPLLDGQRYQGPAIP